MGLTNAGDPTTGDSLYNHIKNQLESSTQSSNAGSLSLFDRAFQYEAIQTAIEMNMNVTAVAISFQDVSSSTAVVASTFTEQLLRTPFPTSTPTSMPSCGVGSEDGINGCEPCPKGTYRSVDMVHASITCQECPIDTYADESGLDECKSCPLPQATLKKGSASCDSFSLRGDNTVITILFTLIGVILLGTNYAAEGDRLATAVFSLAPSLDFISDLAYVTQVKFFNPTVFYVAVISLFLSSFMFIHELIKIRAYPKFLIPFPGKYIFSRVLWLSHQGMSPLVDGHRRDFERHDNVLKLLIYFALWGFLIGLQVLWIMIFSYYIL